MTRILHRYVSVLFLTSTGVFLLTLTALFFLVEFVTKARMFFSLTNPLPFLGQYFLLRLPLVLLYILPVVTLFGAVFTLLRLSRTNELVPVVTAGMSLRRLMMPFLAGALLCGGIVAALDEIAVPAVSEPIAEMEEVLVNKELSYSVTFYNEDGDFIFANEYHHLRKEMGMVSLRRIAPPNIRRFALEAKRGIWDGSRWTFFDGKYQEFDDRGEPFVVERPGQRPIIVDHPIPPEGISPDIRFSPKDLKRTFVFTASPLTYRELLEKIRRYPHIPVFRVQFHSKIIFPLSPLTLLMVGIPFVVTLGRHGMVRGMVLCLLVCLVFYAAHFVAVDLGSRGTLPPVTAVWAPTLLFGGVGMLLFLRVRT